MQQRKNMRKVVERGEREMRVREKEDNEGDRREREREMTRRWRRR